MGKKLDQTTNNLRFWQKDSAEAERLAGQILHLQGFTSIDPIHPLGGPDGLQDIVFRKGEKNWIAAVWFPRDPQEKTMNEVTSKFEHDIEGIRKHSVQGIAFFTNRHLTLGERNNLQLIATNNQFELDLYHMERIAHVVNTPAAYGVRLDFFGIKMSKEEQIAFVSQTQAIFDNIGRSIVETMNSLASSVTEMKSDIQKEDIAEKIHRIRDAASSFFNSHASAASIVAGLNRPVSINDLAMLADQFARLDEISSVINKRIDQLNMKMNRLMGRFSWADMNSVAFLTGGSTSIEEIIDKLQDWEDTLERVEGKIDRVLEKQLQLNIDQDELDGE